MSAGILFVVVVAVTSAVTAGQQNAYEAHLKIAGTMAAEDLLGRLSLLEYASLASWTGYSEEPGPVVGVDGEPAPDSMALVGRQVTVIGANRTYTNMGVTVFGREVRVRAVDGNGRILVELVRFIPEPQS